MSALRVIVTTAPVLDVLALSITFPEYRPPSVVVIVPVALPNAYLKLPILSSQISVPKRSPDSGPEASSGFGETMDEIGGGSKRITTKPSK